MGQIYDKIINRYNKARGNGLYSKLVRRFWLYATNFFLPYYFLMTKSKYRLAGRGSSNIIISLTSFPGRINTIHLVIESLLRQKLAPERVILWLADSQFAGFDSLPVPLKEQCNRGLEIVFVDEDIRSYKKYVYSFERHPEKYIVTVDDDILYDSNMTQQLLDAYQKAEGKRVIARYGCVVTLDKEGNLLPYKDWKCIKEKDKMESYFFGSGGGTLFNPSDLYKDVTNKELFLKLAPSADDIWLNAMCRLGEVQIIMCDDVMVFPIMTGNDSALYLDNVMNNGNDLQIESVDNYYQEKLGKRVFKK